MTVYLGVDYQRHDGGVQNLLTGQLIVGPRNQFLACAGAQAVFALTDVDRYGRVAEVGAASNLHHDRPRSAILEHFHLRWNHSRSG